jgi:6-phosphogluconate dehydrogenase
MRFGIVGLGRMGASLALQAVEKGHDPICYSKNVNESELTAQGVRLARSLPELINQLDPPRLTFLYVPHGTATDEVCRDLVALLGEGDVVVDGGNSHWQQTQNHHRLFAEVGVRFLDVGTSGGIEGARNGACFMVGGDREAFELAAPLLRDLAIDNKAVVFAGVSGAGHFVKLIHNAIEFGMVQAIGEGVEMLQRSEFELDLARLFETWNHGSVIRSWLVELMARALAETPDFSGLSTFVEDTEEVKWVVNWATDNDIPAPVVNLAQQALLQYRDLDWPAAKAVALLRNQFGGHPVHKKSTGKVKL